MSGGRVFPSCFGVVCNTGYLGGMVVQRLWLCALPWTLLLVAFGTAFRHTCLQLAKSYFSHHERRRRDGRGFDGHGNGKTIAFNTRRRLPGPVHIRRCGFARVIGYQTARH